MKEKKLKELLIDAEKAYNVYKAMHDAVPDGSTTKDVITAAESIIVECAMQGNLRGDTLSVFQIQVFQDICKLCELFIEEDEK